ncbi:MAG TPA: hypothetical protein ENH48_00420 [Halieaceae bacterium]|nr:MAG: hypothetical protein DRQ98_01150 [Gammaproteobacteria bacterium]HDY81407.1 hypothetical protein [Halieaceae bacterium]
MQNSFFHRLSSLLWGVIVTLIVVLAIYVSLGRMLAFNLGAWQVEILRELNSRMPFTVEAKGVSGEWQSFTPIIVLKGLSLSAPGSAAPPLELSEGRIGVDVFNSLRTRSLQMTRVALDDLSLYGEFTAQRKLRIRGLDGGGGQIGEWLREFLLNVELVALRNNSLQLTMPNGDVRDLSLDLLLSRDGSHRQMEASLLSTAGTDITILAEGVGDPFEPDLFSGELYLDIQSTNMGAVKDMLVVPPAVWADGTLELELWLAWNKGKPTVEARLEARDLLIAGQDQSWQVPLDRIAVEARLLERRNHWTLFASGLEVEKDGVVVQLPRLQFDTWGDAVRLRTTDVSLVPINDIVTGLDAIPVALADVLRVLQPRGTLSSLQFSMGDIAAPVKDWEVEANFEGLAVDSWKGAPGVTSASGYVQMAPGGGFVVLDSQQLTMDFPTIYKHPLRYEDFHGTINIDWGADTLSLSSGLVTALGEEGTAQVLFGLSVPLVPTDIGIEMDLLVGLEDSHPTHRVKYVPDVLNPVLRGWLSDSIGEGLVEQGAFAWRGTVRPNTAPLHTIQLAFNVADTGLNYHPHWPPVTILDGIILIDDVNVSVWADHARLFESQVEHLSVETWLNEAGQLMLAVDGMVRGPAADGLAVLNDSPLTRIVGGAFADWELMGDLHTDLKLQMNLTDKSTLPRVDVTTRWYDVGLDITPGNLPVRKLNGEFAYSTTDGFSSTDLAGELWGVPLNASVGQRNPGSRDRYDPGSSVVEVAIATKADMADVRQWLNLEPLAFAQGKTAADIKVLVAPGESPLLIVDSALAGVSLDLPRPWRKSDTDERQFHLEMPLAGGGNRLSLTLGEQLKLELDVADGALRAGALAIAAEPGLLEEGVLRINGHVPLIQGDEWLRFASEYFIADSVVHDEAAATGTKVAPESALAVDPAVVAGSVGEDSRSRELAIIIDQLQVDTLVIGGQELQDVRFSLAIESALWRLSFATDWVRGKLLLAQDDTVSQLEIEYLDLSALDQLELAVEENQPVLELPAIDVTINDLYQGDQRLGELAFDLRSQGAVLTANNIIGELASIQLRIESPGRLVWRQGSDSQSELQATFSFDDLGQTLAYFDYQKIMETKKGKLDVNLRWPGPPQGLSLATGRGVMQIDIGHGSFLEAPPGATGALRVVSILNLADIVRRLSLSHMFESGIPFDSVDGEVFLHGGTIEVARMDVKGGSSFQFSGVSEVTARSLDGELVATLPMANNLPWIVALAASLPVAAGVYVVSKIFDKQVNRLSSAVYSISGSWDDPQVEFDHIFDASSQRTGSAAAQQIKDDQTPQAGPAAGGELPHNAPDSQAPNPQTPDQSGVP